MPPVQPRVRGTALDQTFGNDFPYRDGKLLKLRHVPQRVLLKCNDGSQKIEEVTPADSVAVEEAYEAVHRRLGKLGYKLLVTDGCVFDAGGNRIGNGSPLLVRSLTGTAVGSFDGIVSDDEAGERRLGAVDVKYTERYNDLQGLSTGFDFLQNEKRLAVKRAIVYTSLSSTLGYMYVEYSAGHPPKTRHLKRTTPDDRQIRIRIGHAQCKCTGEIATFFWWIRCSQ